MESCKTRNKWKQDVFNEQSQDTSEIKLEPVYRIKEALNKTNAGYDLSNFR